MSSSPQIFQRPYFARCKDYLEFHTLYKIYFCLSSKSFHLSLLLIKPHHLQFRGYLIII